jgi:hypothetical protein
MSSAKTTIIEQLFEARWDEARQTLTNPVVTLGEVVTAIRSYNADHPRARPMSDRNPANFFKDFIRNKARANQNWPASVLARGVTARQVTGASACFEFVPLLQGQTVPFPLNLVPAPTATTPHHRVESVSLPLASRKLGRPDEPWLVQVLVRLRVIETHLSLYSDRRIVQIDHLQMSVKLARSEIDALFLAIEETGTGGTREIIVSCEAKGRRDDILEDQVMRQVQAVFGIPGITQDAVIPVVVKAIGRSRVHFVEFEAVSRASATDLQALAVASEAVYEFVPPIPGIGG